MLAVAGAAIGQSINVRIKCGWDEPCLVYIVQIARPGRGKSPANKAVTFTLQAGEQAQIEMKIPLDVTKVFQGILLFYVLACDSLILYRFRLISASPKVQSGAH